MVLFLVVFGFLMCIKAVWWETAREMDFQHRYGDSWRAQYEDTFGSLSHARTRAVLAATGMIAIPAATIWLFRVLREQMAGGQKRSSWSRGKRHKPRHHSGESPIERVVRYRRRALLGIYFGVPGILLSVALTLFRFGIFADHANEVTLAIFIFLGAYSTVVTGCYWWVKAKAWHEAVIFIAFMPLVIFLIPFVRLLVLAAPQLLMAAMVIMPLILVVVVAVLPDKSGIHQRRASWETRRNQRETSRIWS